MITKTNAVQTQTNITSQPSFKGGRWNVIKYALNPLKKVNKEKLLNRLSLDADTIQLEKEQGINNPVLDVNKPLNRHKAGFLYRLVRKFYIEKFFSPDKRSSEKRQLVYDMYYKVKYPTDTHKYIAMCDKYSLNETNQIFELMNQDKSKLDLAKKLLTTFRKKTYMHIPAKELIEILSSDSCKILNKKYSKLEKFILEKIDKNDFLVDKMPQLLESFAKECK